LSPAERCFGFASYASMLPRKFGWSSVAGIDWSRMIWLRGTRVTRVGVFVDVWSGGTLSRHVDHRDPSSCAHLVCAKPTDRCRRDAILGLRDRGASIDQFDFMVRACFTLPHSAFGAKTWPMSQAISISQESITFGTKVFLSNRCACHVSSRQNDHRIYLDA
jgi:hypothetical protein